MELKFYVQSIFVFINSPCIQVSDAKRFLIRMEQKGKDQGEGREGRRNETKWNSFLYEEQKKKTGHDNFQLRLAHSI